MFTAMLDGWRHQQLARNLALATIAARERAARAFAAHADAFPWAWSAALLDEWLGDLSSARSGTWRSWRRTAPHASSIWWTGVLLGGGHPGVADQHPSAVATSDRFPTLIHNPIPDTASDPRRRGRLHR